MITKYYVDPDGAYLGAYVGAEPPEGSIEVPAPPADGAEIWDGIQFSPAPARAPQEVSMRQARLSLLARGVLGQVDAAIDSLPSPDREAARIEWDYSSVVARDSPLVEMMGAALGLDESALDELFITAARL
jgi:hypothetical protein